ncbi:MAG: FAD-binding protein [Clostridium sp.]|uniref:FAD-dependent oxidoreductase n=1 Tax=Clostridium sp. TaxID=1506 RepID=UPI003F2FCF7A
MEIIRPIDKIYRAARLDFNRAIQKYPCLIVYCSSFSDVQNAILYAQKQNLRIRVRTGGHNYEGFSNGDKALVIDISNLNKITLNYKNNTLSAQAGAYLAEIYNLLGSRNIPFPGGACPTVSISGLTLGGGWGYSARYLGLTCDSVTEISLIDYNGKLLTCSKKENSALFFALRGAGGGNFGVVVAFKFRLPNKVCNVTQFTINYSNISKSDSITFFKIWESFIKTAPNEINMKCSISKNSDSDEVTIFCTGLFYGCENALLNLLKPFDFTSGFSLDLTYTSFLQAILFIGASYPQEQTFFSYGRFVDRDFTDSEIESLVNIIYSKMPLNSQTIEMNFYGLGGKVRDFKDTSFFYRNSNYILLIETTFSDRLYSKENKAWIDKNAKLIYPITNGSYINFPYSPLPNYLYDYFGCNVCKLKAIKSFYDPLNVFNFPQGIN